MLIPELTANERGVLRDVYKQSPAFREFLHTCFERGYAMCPVCEAMVDRLYSTPERFRPYIGVWFAAPGSPAAVCLNCLAAASTKRNQAVARERLAESGVIVSPPPSWLGIPYAPTTRPDLDGLYGQVYLARQGELIKIGATKHDVDYRISQLGGRKKFKKVMALSLRSPFALEGYLHTRFRGVCAHGEYFRLGKRELEFVRNIKQFNGEAVAVQTFDESD